MDVDKVYDRVRNLADYHSEVSLRLWVENLLENVPEGLPEDVCWPWGGKIDTTGHAFYASRAYLGTAYVNRLLWIITRNRLPEGEIVYSCQFKGCANPLHLKDVPKLGNLARGHRQEPKKVCLRGHPKRQAPRGVWYCPQCVSLATTKWDRRNRGERRGVGKVSRQAEWASRKKPKGL